MRAPHLSKILLATALGLLALTSCSNDGRALAEPSGSQTTTTRPPPPTSAPVQQISDSGMLLSSPDFEPGAMTPVAATCAGDNKFPTLTWTDVPDGTAELAIALSDQTDQDATLLIWLMAGIDPAAGTLPGGQLLPGAFETQNDYGNTGYGSPCLENVGAGLRDLQFRIYALPTESGLEAGAHGHDSWDTVAALSFDTATLLMQIEATLP